MAALTLPTPNKVAIVYPNDPGVRVRNRKLAVAVQAGQSVYQATTGRVGLCNTATAGRQQFRGIALESGNADDTVSVLERGEIAGYDLSGSNADDLIYAQDTDGALGTTAGTKSVPVGRVVCMANYPTMTKVLLIDISTLINW